MKNYLRKTQSNDFNPYFNNVNNEKCDTLLLLLLYYNYRFKCSKSKIQRSKTNNIYNYYHIINIKHATLHM